MRKSIDYEQFSLIRTNRKIQNGLVQRLKKSIQKIGYIEARPILVNEKMEIIDGQNRFVACKELGLPIIYAIKENGVPDDVVIAELNKNQLVWRLSDFVHHFTVKGIKYHSVIYDFEEKYKLGISLSIIVCSNNVGSNSRHIREGTDRELNPKREDCVRFILDCKGLFFYKSKVFVQACVFLFRKASKEQIAKLKKKYLSIPHQPSANGYLNVFQNIINKNTRPGDKIVF